LTLSWGSDYDVHISVTVRVVIYDHAEVAEVCRLHRISLLGMFKSKAQEIYR